MGIERKIVGCQELPRMPMTSQHPNARIDTCTRTNSIPVRYLVRKSLHLEIGLETSVSTDPGITMSGKMVDVETSARIVAIQVSQIAIPTL